MYEGKLFNEVALGSLSLKNCIAMAPLTRQCAEDDGTPNDEMVAYYARRARGGVGLIISEGTYPADNLSAGSSNLRREYSLFHDFYSLICKSCSSTFLFWL